MKRGVPLWPSCGLACCPTHVSMMKDAHLWDLHDCAKFVWLDGSRFRRIFVQRQMGSRILVIL